MHPPQCAATALHAAAAAGKLDVVKYLVLERNVNPSDVDEFQVTPLHIACEKGHTNLVSFLLDLPECNVEACDVNKETPIMYAIEHNHLEVVKLVITKLKNAKENLLHYAARLGKLDSIKLLTSFIDVLSSDEYGITALHVACLHGHFQVVDYLSSVKDINKLVDFNKKSPLHYAVTGGNNLCIVKLLVQEKFHNPLCTDIEGNAPLHTATIFGYLEIVKWFISELNLNPNFRTQDDHRLTVFHIACSEGMGAIVDYLAHLPNCNKMCLDTNSFTGLHYAAQKGHTNIVKYILENGCCDLLTRNIFDHTALQTAIQNEHLDSVKLLISAYEMQGIKITAPTEFNGSTILHFACRKGNVSIVEYMLSKIKRDFMLVTDSCGVNPLHSAVRGSNIDVVNYLIETNPHSKLSVDKKGNNILNIAAYSENVQMVCHIIDVLKVDPQSQNNYGITALHVACVVGNKTLTKVILERYTPPEVCNNDGHLSIHRAAEGGHLHVVKELVSNKHFNSSTIFNKSHNGDTSCHIAAREGYTYVVDFFITSGQDPTIYNYSGQTVNSFLFMAMVKNRLCSKELALHRAAENGFSSALLYLLKEEQYKPNSRDQLQRTPLHFASMRSLTNDNLSCITHLLEAGADILAEDVFHNLPIHYAAALGQLHVVKCLLTYKSPCATRGVFSMTPLEMAIAGGHTAIIQSLTNDNSLHII